MLKIIAPGYQHDIISKQLLKNKNTLTDITILPLSGFINQLIGNHENNYDQILKERLASLADDLKVLSPYVGNDTFIKAIKDFHIDAYLYNIDNNDLNNVSVKDQDLSLIFNTISDLIPSEINAYNKLQELVNPDVLSNVLVSKQHLSSNYHREVYNLLIKNGAKELKETILDTKEVHLYYANNIRSEVEASAQLIVNNKLTNATVIALNKEYLPLIEQVYARYNINFNLIKPSVNNNFFIKFINVLMLLEESSQLSVEQFLSSNPFDLDNITSLIKLNDFFKFDLERLLEYKYIPIIDDIVHQKNLEYYQSLALKSEGPILALKSILNNIYSDNKLTLIENLFNYLLSINESEELRTIRSILMNNKDLLNIEDNVWPIVSKLLLRNSTSKVDVNSVVVTETLDHYYFNKKDLVILGASANNFQVINKKTGIIDEKFVEKLSYPTKESRYNRQLKEQEAILNGENIYILYPLSSYEGKAIEPSFALVDFAKSKGAKPQRYPLIENDANEFKTYKLDKELAKKLFFKDNMLYGSISSFEQYNNCNYSYFLKYGLKLYPKQLPDLSYAYIGSIIHKVIENVVNRMKTNKNQLDNTELEYMINEFTLTLEELHPTNRKITVVKNLLKRQLDDVLSHLKAVENDTAFKPISTEQEFTYTINNNIELKGFVDRVDQHLDALRVIDYKSSSQSLSESQFKKGLQLQLITYLLVMSERFNLKPAGAFYQTMRLSNSAVVAAKVSKRDGYIPLLDADIDQQFLTANKMSGWHFIEPDGFYESNNYVSQLTLNKSGLSVYGKPKNFETVTVILHQIYKDIYDNLSNGLIDCLPVDGPCTYCEYQSICQTKTFKNFKEQIYQDQHLSKEINNEMD